MRGYLQERRKLVYSLLGTLVVWAAYLLDQPIDEVLAETNTIVAALGSVAANFGVYFGTNERRN